MKMKAHPNHRIYISVLRKMSSGQRLQIMHGLRKKYAQLPNEEIKKIYLERIMKCHNRNY